MRYYLSKGRVYQLFEDGKACGCDVRVEERSEVVRKVTSVSVSAVGRKTRLPADAVPVTVEEVVRRFHVGAESPLLFNAGERAEGSADAQQGQDEGE